MSNRQNAAVDRLLKFADLVIRSYASRLAQPNMRGPNFTWDLSFPEMATDWVGIQWAMANRNVRLFEANREQVLLIAKSVAQEHKESRSENTSQNRRRYRSDL